MFVQELGLLCSPVGLQLFLGRDGNFCAEAFKKYLIAEGAWAHFFWKLVSEVFQV